MTKDRRFKHRVRRRMRETGETYSVALAAEQMSRPPPRSRPAEQRLSTLDQKETQLKTKPAAATRLRGIWLGVKDMAESRAFYELLGAYFDGDPGVDGIMYATLGGTRLIFEGSPSNAHPGAGYFLLFDVTDADALHAELQAAGCDIRVPPRNEPWGRQFNVHDPDGYAIAFIGPTRTV